MIRKAALVFCSFHICPSSFCVYDYHYDECGSFEVNVKRREGQVPRAILYNMINSIEWPTGDEYDAIHIKRN